MNTEVLALKAMSLSVLDSHIKSLVCSERKFTDQILKAITELDVRRGYAELGFSSLFSYLTVGVGYSESSAQRRIVSARLLAKLSEPVKNAVREKLQEGALNLSQVSKLGSMVQAIEQANKNTPQLKEPTSTNSLIEKLLPAIEHKDSIKTENAIASSVHDLFPGFDLGSNSPEQKAKIRQGAHGKVTITLTLTAEQNAKLKKVLAKKSHAIANGDVNILLEKLLDKELKNYNVKSETASSYTSEAAVTKEAEINLTDDSKVPPVASGNKRAITKRRTISVKVRRRVYARAGHQCQYKSSITGERCQEKNFLTIDHVVPLALAGADEEFNMQCLCSSHNHSEARRMGIAH